MIIHFINWKMYFDMLVEMVGFEPGILEMVGFEPGILWILVCSVNL
jgi:hypothetical protein